MMQYCGSIDNIGTKFLNPKSQESEEMEFPFPIFAPPLYPLTFREKQAGLMDQVKIEPTEDYLKFAYHVPMMY